MRSTVKKRRRDDSLLAAALLAIPIGWWFITSLVPLVFGFVLGFLDWPFLGATPKFAGLKNFVTFFTSKNYYLPLIRSFTIGGSSFLLTTLFGFFVAMALNKITFLKGLFRTVWYIPVITAGVAVTQIFNILLDPFNGVINNTLADLFGTEPIIWMDSTGWSVFWILVYSVWKGVGGSALLWLAGLQSLDKNLSEAAAIDGAGRIRTFISVEMPQLLHILVFIVITGFTAAMQIYEQVLFISNGGPYGTTEVLAFRIMYDAFNENNFGMAGASSMVMTLVTFAVSLFAFRLQKDGVK